MRGIVAGFLAEAAQDDSHTRNIACYPDKPLRELNAPSDYEIWCLKSASEDAKERTIVLKYINY